MRVLVTNDDGIHAAGLAVLARTAKAAGHDVVVAAPSIEKSGYGAALVCTEDHQGVVHTRADELSDRLGVEAWSVDASPAMIAYSAGSGLFGARPDLVLSGINRGANVGAAVIHSGTVGAAMAAAMQQMPAIAVSSAARDPQHWETHEHVVARSLSWAAENLRVGHVLNVNIPDVPLSELRGARTAHLSSIDLSSLDGVRAIHAPLFAALADLSLMNDTDADAVLLRQSWATLSLLLPPRHDTAPESLEIVAANILS